jgi:hypothetical protein
MNDDIKKVICYIVARCLYPEARDIVDADLEFIASCHYEAILEGSAAITALFVAYNSDYLGKLVTKIRGAEGIDTDVIDQILGVQPEDMEEDDE